MKKIIFFLLILIASNAKSITPNWSRLENTNRHLLEARFSWDYGVTYGIAYGYHFNLHFPMIANIEYSFPSGSKIFDDFKTKYGVQTCWINQGRFRASTNLQGVFRRYENNFVRLVDFGSDFSGTAGYYRNKWFVAGEAGFDKAISTNFKHSKSYRDQYPGVVDGWYEPATGGNFYYGLTTGYSFDKGDLSLKLGKVISQDFKVTPLIPFYLQLGYSLKL